MKSSIIIRKNIIIIIIIITKNEEKREEDSQMMLPLPPQFLQPGGLSRAVAAELVALIKNGVEHKHLRH